MTGKKVMYLFWGFALGLVVFVILRVTGLLDTPLMDALPWCVTIGIVASLLSGFIEQYFRKRTSKRQDTP